ncbi:A/G-specific adenine glycosylase [Thermogladius calderae 1633]|uniref:thymine-DNA glycosylase n=1 Tax=Thermogladius calderae (strain DSM 22663 / VKM B-2946 / 1633) TaxID=1184251 RepID=I3TFT6_THEC1|nr:A/G-specific adenine glycosylase [Thermogladius calderae]AFK51624.1 A/G-specific adenine glycosylase [Thermogladius calderae 1633]
MSCGQVGASELLSSVRERVVRWALEHRFDYPWRVERTPYRVLLAEFLLRRTTRTAVARAFQALVERFPDVESLHSAPLEEVEEALKPLGLYRVRARQLKELAAVIVEEYGGRIPDSWEELVRLPGVGRSPESGL